MKDKQTKKCKTCSQTKAGSEFYRMAKSRDGLQLHCKNCSRLRCKAQYQSRREAALLEPPDLTRVCRVCKEALPAERFQANFGNADGRSNRCRACWAKYHKAYYEANRDAVLARGAQYRAVDPEATREDARRRHARYKASDPEGYGQATRERARRWRTNNPEAARAVNRRHYEKHRDRAQQEARDYQRAWRKANPAKAAVKDKAHRAQRRKNSRCVLVLRFTAEQLAARLSMFPHCWLCGGPGNTVDHVKPVSRGGAHILANLRIACAPCNSSKGSSWPVPTSMRAGVQYSPA